MNFHSTLWVPRTAIETRTFKSVSLLLGEVTTQYWFLFFPFLVFLRQDHTVEFRLTLSSLCSPGWSWTTMLLCLSLPSAGTASVCHHACLSISFLIAFISKVKGKGSTIENGVGKATGKIQWQVRHGDTGLSSLCPWTQKQDFKFRSNQDNRVT